MNSIISRCLEDDKRRKTESEAPKIVPVDSPSAPSGHEVDEHGRRAGLDEDRTVEPEQHHGGGVGSGTSSAKKGH